MGRGYTQNLGVHRITICINNMGFVIFITLFTKFTSLFIFDPFKILIFHMTLLATIKTLHSILVSRSARPNHCNTTISSKTETTIGKGIYLSWQCRNRQRYNENGRQQASAWTFNCKNNTLRSRPQMEKDHRHSPSFSPLQLSSQKDQKRSNKNSTRRLLSETASQKTTEVTIGEQHMR
ncbi:hypothetical protein M9H77_16300 [Catharanthus roseus]|uniref:Uncharacterized protein n=1 Tax=Catharanthus roseus TaxID=4058 RepID=A0ACC0B1D4_CATRO|nr:hypothetical protein M9H77_16300 [Catharanthus roseus]